MLQDQTKSNNQTRLYTMQNNREDEEDEEDTLS